MSVYHCIPLNFLNKRLRGSRHALESREIVLDDEKFLDYLQSSDTRLPSHEILSIKPQDPLEYNTYVGEEIWNSSTNLKCVGDSSETYTEDLDDLSHPPPRFDKVVSKVIDLLNDLKPNGVILQGAFWTADDAVWAVSSRAVSVTTPRDFFLLLRHSRKLIDDIELQRNLAEEKNCLRITESDLPCTATQPVILNLISDFKRPQSSLFRAFIRIDNVLWNPIEKIAQINQLGYVAGITQYSIDLSFPNLMVWSSTDSQKYFDTISRHLKSAGLLDVLTLPVGQEVLYRLLLGRDYSNLVKSEKRSLSDGDSLVTQFREFDKELCAIIAVDLTFESANLPIYILGSELQIFEVDTDQSNFHDAFNKTHKDLKSIHVNSEYKKQIPCLFNASNSNIIGTFPTGTLGLEENIQKEEDVETHLEDVAFSFDEVQFFRLFRSIHHWNDYFNRMVHLLNPDYKDNRKNPSTGNILCPNKPSKFRFIVVAQCHDDLVAEHDPRNTGRSVPIEFTHPELFDDIALKNVLRNFTDSLLHTNN